MEWNDPKRNRLRNRFLFRFAASLCVWLVLLSGTKGWSQTRPIEPTSSLEATQNSTAAPQDSTSDSTEAATAASAEKLTEFERQYNRIAEEVQARTSSLETASLTEEITEQISQLDEQTLKILEDAKGLHLKSLQQEKSATAAPELFSLARVEATRQSEMEVKDRSIWRRLSFDECQNALQNLQSQLSKLSLKRNELSGTINSRDARRKQLPQTVTSSKAAREQLATAGATKSGIENALLLQANQNNWEAKVLQATEQVHSLESEMLLYDAEANLLPLQLTTMQQQEKRLQEDLRNLNEVMAQKRAARIYELRSAFEQSNASEEEPFEQIQDWLSLRGGQPETEDEAGEESESEFDEEDTTLTWLAMARQHDELQIREEELQAELDRWRELFRNMRSRVEPDSSKENAEAIPGFNRWVVERLKKQRQDLPSTAELTKELREIQKKVQLAQSLEYDVTDALSLIQSKQSAAEGDEEQSLQIASQIATAIKEDVRQYLQDLYDLGDLTDQTIHLSQEYEEFIDKQLLWTPNAEGLSLASFQQAIVAGRWLLDPTNWKGIVQLLISDAMRDPFWYFVFAGGIALLLVNRGRLKQNLKTNSTRAARTTCTEFSLSWQSLLDTVLIAVPLPLALLFLNWRLNAGSDYLQDPVFARALANGLLIATATLFPMGLLRQVCTPKGLASQHFDWNEEQVRKMNQHLRWLINFAIPLLVIIGVLVAQTEVKWEESFGRLAFLMLMFLLTVFFALILHPQKGVVSEYLRLHAGGWLDRLRFVWYPILSVAPLTLGILSAVGYHYTAQQFATRLDKTLWMIVLLTVAYSLVKRWLVLNRRKIMMDQARQRLEDAAKQEAANREGTALPPSFEAQQELNLVAVNEQTKSLMTSLFFTAGILWAYYIWSDVLPAILLLDNVVLWEEISLADLLLVIPIVVLTVIATRNLPGLLEIACLQHLPLTKAARYAITTLASYALGAIGIALAGYCIGLSWSRIQWLVAGLGVGLGFGLQEIFANFISGIILLFEQPIRVGDVVTIDGTTGTVARIRIRATTIVNWDRQELIVPNKELITGKLINWTLSDTTNRIVVQVGIAYGSDTRQACEIVRQVCEKHPNIMQDPAPIVTFEGFGDNTLNLVLRAYLSTLEHRLTTIHELHEQIYSEFAKQKVEIAFPQLDLHIRSIPDAMKRKLGAT